MVPILINILLPWALIVGWKHIIMIQSALFKGLNVIPLFGLTC